MSVEDSASKDSSAKLSFMQVSILEAEVERLTRSEKELQAKLEKALESERTSRQVPASPPCLA